VLKLQVLGIPSVLQNQEVQCLPLNKPASLLMYLAVRADWVSRDELLLIYYPDIDEKTARHRLRQVAYRAKQYSWADSFEVTDEQMRWLIQTDLEAFQKLLKQEHYQDALDHYKGEFLQGLKTESLGLETWLELQRSSLAEQCLEASLKLAKRWEQEMNYSEAITLVKSQLQVQPYEESLLQVLMRCYYLQGNTEAALKQFEQFARLLTEDMALEPSEESQYLAQSIREGKNLIKRRHNLPVQATPFLGRKQELRELSALLRQEDCRLITVLATGGMGKTRLSIELAQTQLQHFPEGVFFVALASLSSQEGLPLSIASALNVGLQAQASVESQVIDYLRDKSMLIILDNFEHVLEAALYLVELLEKCPKLKFLVTSRERLKVRAEHSFILTGLDIASYSAEQSASVQLFVQSAKRLKQGFTFKNHLSDITHICNMVEGMPLAIELASTWISLLDPKAIAKEIKQDLHFLATDLQDYPERHKNMYSLMHSSWQRLDSETQQVFAVLSLFAAPFSQEAAQQLSACGLKQLLDLEQRLLIRRNEQGLLDMHPLVKQFSYQKLMQDAEVHEQSKRAMARYFSNCLVTHQERFHSQEQVRILSLIAEQLNNHLLALTYALEQPDESTQTALRVLQGFYYMKGRIQEGYDSFKQFSRILNPKHSYLIKYCQLTYLSFSDQLGHSFDDILVEDFFHYFQALNKHDYIHALRIKGERLRAKGQFNKARAFLLDTLKQVNNDSTRLEILLPLGNCCTRLAKWQEAETYFQEALSISMRLNNDRLRAQTITRLADLKADFGDYANALTYFQEALATYESLGSQVDVSWVCNNLATIYHVLKDYSKAESHYQKSRRISEHIGDRHGVALASMNLAELAHDQNKHADAVDLYEKTLRLYHDLDDAFHETKIKALLASSYLATQNLSKAKQYLQEVILKAQELKVKTLSLDILFHTAVYLHHVKKIDPSYTLSVLWHHPASTEDQRMLVRNYLNTDKPNFKQAKFSELNELLQGLAKQL